MSHSGVVEYCLDHQTSIGANQVESKAEADTPGTSAAIAHPAPEGSGGKGLIPEIHLMTSAPTKFLVWSPCNSPQNSDRPGSWA
jgi:hypothetical protein